jgi:hypothetical protein
MTVHLRLAQLCTVDNSAKPTETEENDVCANDNITPRSSQSLDSEAAIAGHSHANRPVVEDTTSDHEKAHAQIDDPAVKEHSH